MVLGLRTLFSGIGRLASRLVGRSGIGRISAGRISKLGSVGRYSRLGASRASLASKFGGSRASLLGSSSKFGSRASILSKGPKPSRFSLSNIRTKAKDYGSRFLRKTRQGIKGAWRKIEVDPLGTATSAYAATRNPNVTLTIDGLEKPATAEVSNPESFRNFASFSSW